MTHFRSLAVLSAYNRPIWWGQWINTGDRLCTWMGTKNKNIKNSLGATWNASHLAVRLCALRHWKRVSMPSTTQSLRHPLTRASHFAPRIKTTRRFTAKKNDAVCSGTCQRRKHWKTIKIVNEEVEVLWRLVAVGNGWLWLTPCKRMKLRRSEWAQLGDCTKEGVSLVEGRLWSKLLMLPRPTVSDARHYIWTCLQAALASELAWS